MVGQSHLYLRLLSDKVKGVVSDMSYGKLDELSRAVNGFTDLVFSWIKSYYISSIINIYYF